MNDETTMKIGELEKKVDAIFVSVEKTRKYILWTGIITVAFIVLPLIGLVFVIPQFLNTYLGGLQEIN